VPARVHQLSGEVEWLPVRPLPQPQATTPEPLTGVPTGVPPHVALRLLQAGHRRFLGDGKPASDLGKARREQLTHGQQPLAIVLTCADARTPPEHIFDAGLGELFVVRLAGHVLNDDALATIEYAASQLGASLLVVMGHTQCTAFAPDATGPGQLSPHQRALRQRLEAAFAGAGKTGKAPAETAMRSHVLRTVADLAARSAVLRQLEQAGRFTSLASVYDIQTGDLEWLKEQGAATAVHVVPQPAKGHGDAHAGDHATHEHAVHDGGSGAPSADAHGADSHAAARSHAAAHAAPVSALSNQHHGSSEAHGEAHGHDHGHGVSEPTHAPAAKAVATHSGAKVNHDDAHHDGQHGASGDAGTAQSLFDWAAAPAPAGESKASTHAEQGAADHCAPGHGVSAHGAAPHRDSEHHGVSTPPAKAAAPTAPAHGHDQPATTDAAKAMTWRDPMVLVGLGGVLSLLLAALLAIKT
jgi:carbonic anhydrase